MKTKSLPVPFSDIAGRYDLVVVDACALLTYLNPIGRKEGTLEDKTKYYDMERESADFFLELAKTYPNWYVTSAVLREYYNTPTGDFARKERGAARHRGRVRTTSHLQILMQEESRKVLDLRRAMEIAKKSSRRLNSVLVENQRVIRLNEDDDEWGKDIFGAFFDMLPILDDEERSSYTKFERNLSLSERDSHVSSTDLSLVLLGLTKYRAGKSFAIISNDFPIMYVWKHALYVNGLYPHQIGFFLRKEPELFGAAYSMGSVSV